MEDAEETWERTQWTLAWCLGEDRHPLGIFGNQQLGPDQRIMLALICIAPSRGQGL